MDYASDIEEMLFGFSAEQIDLDEHGEYYSEDEMLFDEDSAMLTSTPIPNTSDQFTSDPIEITNPRDFGTGLGSAVPDRYCSVFLFSAPSDVCIDHG
jgi:hypothetical protein